MSERASGPGTLAVIGPLAVYGAKPYAHLQGSTTAVEYLPASSAVRWLWEESVELPDDWGLRQRSLPLPHGLRRLSRLLAPLARRRLPVDVRTARAVVLTSPFHSSLCNVLARVPMLYHVFDEYASYGWTDELIGQRESEILRRADHVIVVSEALARLYCDKYHVPAERVTVVPNGYEPSLDTTTPADIGAVPAPRIGTIGLVTSRIRLDWVLEILDALPWAQWAFVGPVTDNGPVEYVQALEALRRHPRCAFLGAKPYDQLPDYAAAFDVAAFPFSDHILNRGSSPTRFFSQLPFGQPILASDQCEQLNALQPLVRVCGSAPAFVSALEDLRAADFHDGLATARTEYAKRCTWAARGQEIARLVDSIVPHGTRP